MSHEISTNLKNVVKPDAYNDCKCSENVNQLFIRRWFSRPALYYMESLASANEKHSFLTYLSIEYLISYQSYTINLTVFPMLCHTFSTIAFSVVSSMSVMTSPIVSFMFSRALARSSPWIFSTSSFLSPTTALSSFSR